MRHTKIPSPPFVMKLQSRHDRPVKVGYMWTEIPSVSGSMPLRALSELDYHCSSQLMMPIAHIGAGYLPFHHQCQDTGMWRRSHQKSLGSENNDLSVQVASLTATYFSLQQTGTVYQHRQCCLAYRAREATYVPPTGLPVAPTNSLNDTLRAVLEWHHCHDFDLAFAQSTARRDTDLPRAWT